jgi:RNA recognition motif-containing protein
VNIVKDKRSGVYKGFGFIEIASPEENQSAIDGLKDQKLDGRIMDVTESSPPVKTRSAVDSEVEVRNIEDTKEALVIDYSAGKGNICARLA